MSWIDSRPAMPEPVERLLKYAGKTMRTARSPNLTAREAIEVGNWLAAAVRSTAAKEQKHGTTEL